MSTIHGESDAPSTQDHKLAVEYVQTVLGMDALYRAQPNATSDPSLDREGLVPVNLTDLSPRLYTDWSHVQADLQVLREHYATVQDKVRRTYMQQQISSLLALARWASGQTMDFEDQVGQFLCVNASPVSESEMALLHDDLDAALTRQGYNGTLAEKWARWQAERDVPAQQVEGVLRELLAQARQRVADMLFPELADVPMTPVVVHSVPYSAYCDYVGRRMQVNGDLTYSYPALKHLVCHEAFPGHTTHLYIREQRLRERKMPVDAGLVITDTASSPIFEGIGDNGIAFLEWEDEDDRIYQRYQIIRTAAGAQIAHMIHQQGRSQDDAAAYLRRTCFADEHYIAARLRFVRYPLRAPFIYAYWRGYQAVRDVYMRTTPGNRKAFFAFLYGTMLSADTVRLFA